MGDGRFSDLLAEQGQRLLSEEKKYQFWQNVIFVIITLGRAAILGVEGLDVEKSALCTACHEGDRPR